MPDFQQLVVLAFALVPGFIATEVQSFVALKRRPPALETTLYAIAYSAVLYLATTVWPVGPQYDPAFPAFFTGDGIVAALTSPTLVLRYLGLMAAAVFLGWVTGWLLSRGPVRAVIGALTGRNVMASTWQQFFHDDTKALVVAELPDGRRMCGEAVAASDSAGERVIVLAWPSILTSDGRQWVPMGLHRLLLDTEDCVMLGKWRVPPPAVEAKPD